MICISFSICICISLFIPTVSQYRKGGKRKKSTRLVLQIFSQLQNINHKLKSFGFFIKEIIGFFKNILFN